MIDLIKSISKKIGIDGAIAFTVLSRVIQAASGVVTLLFVAKYLTKVEQGYYYTFGSILAIQIFFELGLSGIITQFVAHENANITWHDGISFSGSKESSSRLASLLRFTVKWFAIISVLLFFGLLIAGYLFFSTYEKGNIDVNWHIPWVILSVTTSLSLMVSPILAFFEGLGRVEEVAKIRITQQMVQLTFLLIFFSLGLKLFSSPLAATLSFSIIPFWIFFGKKRKLLTSIWDKIGDWQVNYRFEIFPYQWKIALSWISGYFIFQLFNPVLFATEGAIVAGQMGMTLAALGGISSISMSWINTKIPFFSSLIAQKKFKELDILFNKTKTQLLVVSFSLILFLLLLVIIFDSFYHNLAVRFLNFNYVLLLSVVTFANQLIFSWATYLRCHKKDPYLINSIVGGALCALSTIFLGKYFGLDGIVYGYTFITVCFGLPWAFYVYIKKKLEWHL